MVLKDIFNASKIRKENDNLNLTLEKFKKENERLNNLLTEINAYDLITVKEKIREAQLEIEKIKKEKEKNVDTISSLDNEIAQRKSELIVLDEELLMQSFALYKPKYDFENSDLYKEKLVMVREKQKNMIKNKTAAIGSTNWTVNGKKSEGTKMVNDMIKLVLRAFNNECDFCVINVKFNNIESCEQRIEKSFDALSKLGKIMSVSISPTYKKLKHEELYLAYEYRVKKQEEKEEQRILREQMREEAKLQKEIEEARKSIVKEQKHYINALDKFKAQISNAKTDQEKEDINQKINEMQNQLLEIEKNIKEIDYREADKKAGYVYIISNLGSFGENVFKIGMTRRLDPLDRVSELSDASVPFNFDVHALIFSNDAPSLESALHKAFEQRKLNLVNTRREFFKVTLDEIKEVVNKNHDKTVEFDKVISAEEYRESLKLATVN